jgi:hypothetical protein
LDKQRRQKRFQQKQRHIERQFSIRKINNFTWGYNDNEEQKHRFHKMKGWTCHSGCSLCGNPRTYWGAKTLQEARFECSAVEQIKRDSIGKHEWEDLTDPRMEW